MNKNIVRIIITLVVGFIYFYIALPPINLQSSAFWFFVILLLSVYLFSGVVNITDLRYYNLFRRVERRLGVTSIIFLSIFAIIVLPIVINFFLSPLFISKVYSNRIKVDESSTFAEDIPLVDFNAIPLVDKYSSQKLGDRVMGQMPELVSQFDVSDMYTQINYNNDIIRVTPLEYSDFFKWLSNRKDGVKGYITVNSVNGESNLIKLNKGMKYMDSAFFSTDLNRHLRFNYPTKIFGHKTFEIDNEGNPYWIVPTIKYVGVNLIRDVSGVVILDPITGKSKYYDLKDIPTWVDHVYDANLIIEQVNDWGRYSNGFWNSIFGQKNVVATTEGYNYLAMKDDIYLYTGITSVVSDESNLGFILTNLRTKETHFYSVPGAEEYSAMASAEGQVQQMKYNATFPLLINLNNKPTYLMSLKDNAGLVKMYAFVDVADYQKVVVTDASKGIEVAAQNYLDGNIDVKENELLKKTITVQSINMTLINGNSYYYITDTNNNKYKVNINVEKDKIPFIQQDNTIEIGYKIENEVTEILLIK